MLSKKIKRSISKYINNERERIRKRTRAVPLFLGVLLFIAIVTPELTILVARLIIESGFSLSGIKIIFSAIIIISGVWFILGKDRGNPLNLLIASIFCNYLLIDSYKKEDFAMFVIQFIVFISIIVISIKELIIYSPKKGKRRTEEWRYWGLISVIFLTLGLALIASV